MRLELAPAYTIRREGTALELGSLEEPSWEP
jgi:hypothetical protein